MALPSSGPISLKQVRDELKLNSSISLGQQEVRNLANIPSGRISMSDLRGKSIGGLVKFIDWPDIEDIKLEAGKFLWDTEFNLETQELIDDYNSRNPTANCTWIEASIHPNVYFKPEFFQMPNPATIVEIRAKFGEAPNDYGIVTIDNSPDGNILKIDWYPQYGFEYFISSGYVPLSKNGIYDSLYLDPEFKQIVSKSEYDTENETWITTDYWTMPYPPKNMYMYAKFI